jgi:16S rRNA (cytosine967-C5)-methyltransferase
MSASPARTAAFEILLRVETRDAYASELLHSEVCEALSPADQGLATEIVMGVLRWRSVLDAALAEVSALKLEKLDPEVLIALRMGAYQLRWLERVPARAALHESVELVKQARKRSAAPFANAVLRKIADSPSAKTFQPWLVGVASDASSLAEAMAHPHWLVQTWCDQFGLETAQKICAYDQTIPVTTVRLSVADAEEELRKEGIAFEAGSFLSRARRIVSGDVTKTRAYADGRIAIQDEASQLVAALVGKGNRILDCCAAPGGKTSAIAERNPEATVVATELHAHRAELLRKRVRARNVEVIHSDILELPAGELFDRVLVDVPCSGTGTLARNPEIKWRLKPEDLNDLQTRQVAILQSAMKHGSQGGRVIYSTCSLQREEDEDVIERAMHASPDFRLIPVEQELQQLRSEGELIAESFTSLLSGPYLRTIPGIHACDGFFAAILERK